MHFCDFQDEVSFRKRVNAQSALVSVEMFQVSFLNFEHFRSELGTFLSFFAFNLVILFIIRKVYSTLFKPNAQTLFVQSHVFLTLS